MKHAFSFLTTKISPLAVLLAVWSTETPAVETIAQLKITLGKTLFFDPNLSLNRNQSCATCHNPDVAFIDDRTNLTGGAVSSGSVRDALGDRNSPTISYSMFIPTLSINANNEYIGGQFYDGRSADLIEQAGQPFLDHAEMALPDKMTLLQRVIADPNYKPLLESIYGNSVLSSPNSLFQAVSDSIAAFESTEVFAPFDSRYDRFLAGKYHMSPLEEKGRKLFFSKEKTSCSICHSSEGTQAPRQLFTDFKYWNIALPINATVRKLNDKPPGYIDYGLHMNKRLKTSDENKGKFKTPTLRNIAVTSPYMHNGLFDELTSAIMFYDRMTYDINPETGRAWGMPEVMDNAAREQISQGEVLTADKVEALEAFLKTLTDKRYEHLVY